jgi:hypothetical protein
MRGFPLPRVAGSAWVRHANIAAHDPESATRFSEKAHAKTMRSEALPCLKEDKTASEERLGPRESEANTHHLQRQRFRAVLRIAEC